MRKYLFIIAILGLLTSCENFSTGSKVGIISTVEEKGGIRKSVELTLKSSPILTSNNAVNSLSAEWTTYDYSIDNDGAISCQTPVDSLTAWRDQGKVVRLEYQQVKGKNLLGNRGGSDFFIKKVVPIR